MSKSLYIAEKPSVAQQFADALKIRGRRGDGYIESDEAIVTWCVGHLVTMSYPEAYDMKYKRWSLNTLPFLPKEFKYEVIPSVEKQFSIVKGLLTRPDVDTIYVCTDSGREGEYIYRLVAQMAGVKDKHQKRVWIDSQTEEEILRGIREAKDESEYDNLSASAYLRAKEDYLMGINFSRVLTLRYGPSMSQYLGTKFTVLSVGRVMTCVLGMVVRREREIRNFVKTPFYRVLGSFQATAKDGTPVLLDAEWKAVEGSKYFGTPYLYKENGFKEREKAEELIAYLKEEPPLEAKVLSKEKKKETKNPPLLYNLAELQNDCSKMFKISPDETLKVVQELYEKKLVTYPRTDARVLSTAVAKEIYKNINGLMRYEPMAGFAKEAMNLGSFKGIAKTRYVNDKQITDHYAIIPTGQGMGNLRGLSPLSEKVYQVVCRRFLSIFYPAAIYQKYSLVLERKKEQFFASFKVLSEPGYLKVADVNLAKKSSIQETFSDEKEGNSAQTDEKNAEIPKVDRTLLLQVLADLKKNDILTIADLKVKEGETSPPKRYTSGSMILAMENAGQLIEDEELRAQIKGSGIGTSATRAEILKKLVSIKYLSLNQKTQVITPSLLGEMVYEVVDHSIRQLLNPELTASWEKGLTYVAEGSITSDEYMEKLERFVAMRTVNVTRLNNQYDMRGLFDAAAAFTKQKGELITMKLKEMKIKELFDTSHTIAERIFDNHTYAWEVLPEIGDFIRSLGPLLPENEYRKIGTDIWVHKSAKVAPTIMMAGPMIICEGANVRHSAFLRGNVIIGAGAVVGNSCELKNALIFDEAQIPHFNYVGDSVLGYKAHMGAGAVTSNVKSDKSLVVVHAEDKDVATGFKKFGAILGDGVEVGCNSVLNPGTVVGKESNIYPLSSVRGCVAAHSIYKSQDNIVAKENREEAPAPKKRATRKPKVVK